MARFGDLSGAGAWGLLVLRRLVGPRAGSAAATPHEAPALPGAAPAQGLRVLVVDDDRFNLMLTSEMLAPLGIRPLLASDGAESVALARGLHLDLILMDLNMPVLDGFGATRQIRALEHGDGRPRVPIVAYTSGPDVDPPSLLECGMDAVLQKPCSPQALHECVLRWCPAAGAPSRRADTAAASQGRPLAG